MTNPAMNPEVGQQLDPRLLASLPPEIQAQLRGGATVAGVQPNASQVAPVNQGMGAGGSAALGVLANSLLQPRGQGPEMGPGPPRTGGGGAPPPSMRQAMPGVQPGAPINSVGAFLGTPQGQQIMERLRTALSGGGRGM
jgi:hypothetical protein